MTRASLGASPSGRRPSWIAWVAAVLIAGLTARLGVWQLSRAHEKESLLARMAAQAMAPVLKGGAALAHSAEEAANQHYRRIELEGRWMTDATLYLDNRSMDARTGFIVVTPLLLADERAVLVQRGWLPRNQDDRTRVPPFETPPGRVQVVARIAPWPSKLYEFQTQATGLIRQNIDRDGVSREWKLNLLPLSLQELPRITPAPTDKPDPLLRQWSLPTLNEQRNYGYAAQWFALSALTIGLAVWFTAFRRSAADLKTDPSA